MLVFALCATLAKADVTWRNLSVQRPDRQFLLKPTSGVARAGSVTAVLGASGAGKSTFLRALVNAAPRAAQHHQAMCNQMAAKLRV